MVDLSLFSTRATWCLTRGDLDAAGVSSRLITAAVSSGHLIRARRGVYCHPSAPPYVVRALRVGGLAACVTAAETYGLWVPQRRRTAVWLPANASRLRNPMQRSAPVVTTPPHQLCTHWGALHEPTLAESWRVGPRDALRQCLRCLPPEYAVAVLDSALHLGIVRPHDLESLSRGLSPTRRWWASRADGRAESGTETLVRLALQDAGLHVRPQVRIAGVGRVDLLGGPRVVVEVDSESWHSTPAQRANDARRGLALHERGYVVIRPNYQQAESQRAEVVAAVRAAVRATGTVVRSRRRAARS